MEYKGYFIKSLGTFPCFQISQRNGFVPGMLEGMYLTTMDAKRQIDIYLSSLKKGKKSNVEATSASTD